MDGCQLLLLVHLLRHVANGHDQVLGETANLDDGGRVDFEIAIVVQTQGRTAGHSAGQGRVKGAIVRPENLRPA